MRNDTPEIKMGIHQILTKNGFYRLPMHSLTQILRVLEVSQSVEPKAIQENAIDGIIKIIQKNGSKFADAVLASKIQGVSKQTKDYVCVILNNAFIYLTKGRYSNLYQPSVYQPNMNALSGAPGVPGVPGYPPMRSYSFMNAPGAPSLPTNEGNNNPQNMKMMNQMIRLQQAYMYYYGLYGYMNPYASYGGAQGKQQMNPSNPFLPSLGGGMTGMPMGPMGPMGPMAPMAPGLTGMNHVPQMGQMNPMSFPHKNPQVQTKPFEDPISNMPQRNSAAKQTPKKESQPLKITQKAKSKPQQELYKPEKNYKNEDKKAKSDKSKFSIQNPPFIVNETTNTQANQTKKSNAEKNASQNAKNLQNSSVTTAANQLLKNCVCKGAQKYEQQFLCSICNKTFHYKCLSQPVKRAQNKQSIECYHCRLRFIDPLNKVKEVIAQYYIPNINDNKFWMSCNLKPYENFCRPKNGKNQIQMRCLKVASAENSEITWPDQCIIKLNGERIIQIPALQINSSLKKRKDYSIIITQNIYNKSNQSDNQGLEKIRLSLQIRTLTKEEISHRKIKNNFTFAFAIYFVQRLSVDELYQKIVNEQKVPEPSDYLQRLMRTTSNEIEIDKITISLFDPFTWDLIKTPVRGSKCQHGQCFDLKTFISFMSTARNRTWKCPICGKDARKFMVDSQQMELIKRVQESNSVPSEIAFMKDGKIVLKKDETEDAGQNSSVIHQKTKKIKKQSRDKEDRQSDSKRQSAPQKSNSEYQQPRQASKQLIYNQQSKKVEKFDPQVVEIHQIDEDDDNDKVQNNNEQQIVRQEAIEEENNPS